MDNPIQNFLKAAEKEEDEFRSFLAKDEAGIVFRSIINEFDWFHYNFTKQETRTREQAEQYYLLRLGMTRAIYLAFKSRSSYKFPTVMFERNKELSIQALEIAAGLGMIEHGRRIAHSTKTGQCEISQVDDTNFEFTLPSFLPNESHHEEAMSEYYRSETRKIFSKQQEKILTDKISKSIESLLDELVYVFREKYIGYAADPLLDDYFFGLAYHEIQLQDGFDTFHYSTKFGGIEYQKYILSTVLFSSWSMKHLSFCEALVKKAPQIRMENILTISADRSELVQSLAYGLNSFGSTFEGFTQTSIEEADRIIDVISLTRDNIEMAARPVAPIPYLIQPSKTGLIKLLAGASSEPIHFLLHSLRYHFPKEYDKHQRQREGPFRRAVEQTLNGAFANLEFRNNIKVKQGGKTLTDIDLVVIDKSMGTLILCQLKYQDLHGADILAANSRHTRLREETARWLDAIEGWQGKIGEQKLRATLRLPKMFSIRSVHQLVLSKHYAYPLKDIVKGESSAYANWLQFINAVELMKITQGTIRTTAGLVKLLKKQNLEAKTIEYMSEPNTLYSIGELKFSVRQTESS